MILIAHRGNISGPDQKKENHPDHLMSAIKLGFDVETDVWFIGNKFYLGHDNPSYEIDSQFLKNNNFWCHAKNIDALHEMLKCEDIHCFWHQEDDVTLTSRGYIWTYPSKELFKGSVCVMPETCGYSDDSLLECHGICTDLVHFYEKTLSVL